MGELIAALAAFAAGFEQPVHGANGAMKPAFIQQRGVHLRRRAVLKTLLVKACQHRGLFAFRQRPHRMPIGMRGGRKTNTAPATTIPGRARNRQRLAGPLHSHQGPELIEGGHDHFSPLGTSASRSPNSRATFFLTSMTMW